MGLDMFFTEYKINSVTNEVTQLNELYFRKKYFIANYIRNISFAYTEDTFYEKDCNGFETYIKGSVLTYDTMVDLQVELNNLKEMIELWELEETLAGIYDELDTIISDVTEFITNLNKDDENTMIVYMDDYLF